MNSIADKAATYTPLIDADIALSVEERTAVRKHAIRRAMEMGLISVVCCYVFWIFIPNTMPVWIGLPVFALAIILGYCVARLMLRRQVKAILIRRKNLVRFARSFRNQPNATNLKEI